MNQRLSRIQSALLIIFAVQSFAVILNFLGKKLNLEWLVDWIFIGVPILLIVGGLILRNQRRRGQR